MKIGVNCGHTKSGAGCGAIGFINESDETRKVGYKLMEYLKQAGHTVYDCTNDKAESTNANLSAIVSMANSVSLDLFVSIHFNSARGKGVECYTYEGKQHTEAVNICRNIYRLGFMNRGVKDGSNLYVIKHTNAKAILVEVCFVDTKSDTALYELRGADKIAKAICEAITGKTVEDKKETETPKEKGELFKDVPKTDSAYNHIKKLKDYGIVNGYGDGTFKPDSNITRREMSIMLANTLNILGK